MKCILKFFFPTIVFENVIFAFLIRYWDEFKLALFSSYLYWFHQHNWSNYWCTNVNDTYVMLCYRNQNADGFTGKTECLISEDGISFTEPGDRNHKVYELNHDYDRYAKMTTFMGKATLVGVTSDKQRDDNFHKFVEVFNSDTHKWELKWKSTIGENSIQMIQYYGLVSYKDKLMHLGGNKIKPYEAYTGYSVVASYSGKQFFYLDSSFAKWERAINYHVSSNFTKGKGMGLSLTSKYD